jgi:protein TonB
MKRYPLLARRSRVEGRASVRIELSRTGVARRVELQHADHPLLGEAAVVAVRAAAPFPAPPLAGDAEALRVEIPLRFALEGR